MVQILPNRDRSFLDSFLGGAAESARESSKMIPEYQKMEKEQQRQDFLSQLMGKGGARQQMNPGQQLAGGGGQQGQTAQGENGAQQFSAENLSDADLMALSLMGDPQSARLLQHAKDVSLREARENKKFERDEFREERKYHTDFSKEAEKEIETMRSSIPRKENALNQARNSVETGDVSFFSPDKLADSTGIDLFRTSKGAQLVTAGKENLLSNMSRVSARGQNVWFEQRLNSMFAKIGQSREANLTVQEMLEGETALDKAYLNEFDRLSEEDMKNFGFVKKDIGKRARNNTKSIDKHIMDRTSYRMKEVEEQERGLSTLKREVGKNVIKGTPLTLAMAKLYAEKFGDNALAVAKKNGYTIPTIEDFQTYQQRPQEFREGL